MKAAHLEAAGWFAAVALAAGLVWSEGGRRAVLEAKVPVAAKDLYRTLARSQTGLQIVDVREDLSSGYGDAHVPGAIPLPGCDLAQAPERARARIVPSAPTVLVGATGASAETARCAGLFTSARTLAGGMAAWDDASLPEDSGEYTPPSSKAGGGCL
jgi:rhodanese-related sulfurtransferase